MSNRVGRAVLSLVVALAMTFGSLLPHAAHSPWQNPTAFAVAETERHFQDEVEIAEHGHTHGDEYEQAAGHSHGHNPADHSHETPTAPARTGPVVPAMVRIWAPASPNLAHLGASYRLERPPRPILLA